MSSLTKSLHLSSPPITQNHPISRALFNRSPPILFLSLSLFLSQSSQKPKQEMVSTGFSKDNTNLFFLRNQRSSITQKLLLCALSILLLFAVTRFYFFPLPPTQALHNPTNLISISPEKTENKPEPVPEVVRQNARCDLSDGEWVRLRNAPGPLYNGSLCAIKEGQDCQLHGRPDKGYLDWIWQPKQCNLPRFEPHSFLQLLRHKHLAFIGDSMARNQFESLMCLLSLSYAPQLVYQDGSENKFRRWYFPIADVNVSLYWSPFLVKGDEKSSGFNYNRLYLDKADEKWLLDLKTMDMVVFSVGHWFLHPAVYFEKNQVLGCHYCPDLNHTEIGFYGVFEKAIRTALSSVLDQRRKVNVILTGFSPAHFEGEWDKAGACPRTEPYKEGEKVLEGMDEEMRKVEVAEVGVAKGEGLKQGTVRFELLDVTKLAVMRADGHPGPYMNPFPFADGVKDRIQNDCVHWCLPGAIDTWNEMMLEVMKRWEVESKGGRR